MASVKNGGRAFSPAGDTKGFSSSACRHIHWSACWPPLHQGATVVNLQLVQDDILLRLPVLPALLEVDETMESKIYLTPLGVSFGVGGGEVLGIVTSNS